MKNCAEFAMEIYQKHFPAIRLWAGIDDRNTAMRKLFTNLRFKMNEENSDLTNNWLIMTKK